MKVEQTGSAGGLNVVGVRKRDFPATKCKLYSGLLGNGEATTTPPTASSWEPLLVSWVLRADHIHLSRAPAHRHGTPGGGGGGKWQHKSAHENCGPWL